MYVSSKAIKGPFSAMQATPGLLGHMGGLTQLHSEYRQPLNKDPYKQKK